MCDMCNIIFFKLKVWQTLYVFIPHFSCYPIPMYIFFYTSIRSICYTREWKKVWRYEQR